MSMSVSRGLSIDSDTMNWGPFIVETVLTLGGQCRRHGGGAAMLAMIAMRLVTEASVR